MHPQPSSKLVTPSQQRLHCLSRIVGSVTSSYVVIGSHSQSRVGGLLPHDYQRLISHPSSSDLPVQPKITLSQLSSSMSDHPPTKPFIMSTTVLHSSYEVEQSYQTKLLPIAMPVTKQVAPNLSNILSHLIDWLGRMYETMLSLNYHGQ